MLCCAGLSPPGRFYNFVSTSVTSRHGVVHVATLQALRVKYVEEIAIFGLARKARCGIA